MGKYDIDNNILKPGGFQPLSTNIGNMKPPTIKPTYSFNKRPVKENFNRFMNSSTFGSNIYDLSKVLSGYNSKFLALNNPHGDNLYGAIGKTAETAGNILTGISGALKSNRPSLSDKIGLNSFAEGGSMKKAQMGMDMASTAMSLIGNAFEQSKIEDTSEQKAQLNAEKNRNVEFGSIDDLMSSWNNMKQFNHINSRDLRNKTWLEDVGNIMSASGQGASAGSQAGPIGAGIGAAIGGLTSLGGILAGRKKASKEADKLNRQIDITNATIQNSYRNAATGLNKSLSYNQIANSMAYGGPIHIKDSKKGTFTKAASKRGLSVQEFAEKVLGNRDLYSPEMIKKANFARNSKKWHKI